MEHTLRTDGVQAWAASTASLLAMTPSAITGRQREAFVARCLLPLMLPPPPQQLLLLLLPDPVLRLQLHLVLRSHASHRQPVRSPHRAQPLSALLLGGKALYGPRPRLRLSLRRRTPPCSPARPASVVSASPTTAAPSRRAEMASWNPTTRLRHLRTRVAGSSMSSVVATPKTIPSSPHQVSSPTPQRTRI